MSLDTDLPDQRGRQRSKRSDDEPHDEQQHDPTTIVVPLVPALPVQTNGSGGKTGKRRGTVFTCESCSKVRLSVLAS